MRSTQAPTQHVQRKFKFYYFSKTHTRLACAAALPIYVAGVSARSRCYITMRRIDYSVPTLPVATQNYHTDLRVLGQVQRADELLNRVTGYCSPSSKLFELLIGLGNAVPTTSRNHISSNLALVSHTSSSFMNGEVARHAMI